MSPIARRTKSTVATRRKSRSAKAVKGSKIAAKGDKKQARHKNAKRLSESASMEAHDNPSLSEDKQPSYSSQVCSHMTSQFSAPHISCGNLSCTSCVQSTENMHSPECSRWSSSEMSNAVFCKTGFLHSYVSLATQPCIPDTHYVEESQHMCTLACSCEHIMALCHVNKCLIAECLVTCRVKIKEALTFTHELVMARACQAYALVAVVVQTLCRCMLWLSIQMLWSFCASYTQVHNLQYVCKYCSDHGLQKA